jgi:PAS domain S-box-containing protein
MRPIAHQAPKARRADGRRSRVEPRFEFMDYVPAAIVVVAARDLTVLHANRACAELLDLDPEQVRGRPVAEVLPGDDQGLLELLRAARDTCTPLCVNHFRFSGDPDVERVWTLRLTPKLEAATGKASELVLSLADATERLRLAQAAERAAEAERQRAEQLDAVFASMADAVVLVDAAGKVKKCNDAAAALFDLGAATDLGLDAPQLALRRVNGAPIGAHESPLARALRMETVQREEATVVRPGRPPRLVSVSAAPVLAEGAVAGAVAVFHDISDIRDAEQRVERALHAERRRARQARTLYDAARAVSSDLNLRDRLNVMAETMAEAVGVGRCFILLLQDSELKVAAAFGVSPGDAELLDAAITNLSALAAARSEAMEKRRPAYAAMADAGSATPKKRRPVGALNMKAALLVPLAYGNRVTGLAVLDEPGARRKFTESDRSIALAISAQGAVAIENARLYEVEQERARMLEVMMAELNHRVKNNLAIVSGLLALQITESDPRATKESALRDCITRIQSISLIHQILHEENVDAVDMRETARRIAGMACDTLSAPGHRIRCQVRGDALMIPCKTATSLGLVMNELVCNAVKHGLTGRPRGRVSINIKGGDPIRIRVSDNGRGLPRGFDPAAHGHVGLLVVRGLVETELGGTFVLRRNPRGGAIAAVDLPFSVAAPSA